MQSLHPHLNFVHSILRYLILLLAFVVVVQSLVGMMGKKKFQGGNKRPALILLICCDLQLLLGLVLYYLRVISGGMLGSGHVMKDPYTRFYAVEHSVSMILAIVLVHLGYAVTKKNIDDDRKFRRLFWYVFIALVIFVAMIPWEGKQLVGRPNIPVLPS
ncbi:MAG: hypothetical protein V4649_14270 [Bacteroidota bacterium]